ncbi:MAG: 6-pyruvoyl trahydropterin synthase family protein [Thermoguttaceae bacterium]
MPHTIRLTEPELTFTASHGIKYESGELEPLHEHEFRVIAEISGPLNAAGYVVDFIAASDVLKRILCSLHGKILLAENEEKFRGNTCENLLVLPIRNTTAELIAEYIANQFESLLRPETITNKHSIKIELEESPGCWACFSNV